MLSIGQGRYLFLLDWIGTPLSFMNAFRFVIYGAEGTGFMIERAETIEQNALEEITGKRTPEDVLQRIFEKFCIGK